MNYEKIYYNLIEKAKNKNIEGYFEKHHIIPKSLGGSNDKSNIVKLTPREHYIAHRLLPKFLDGKDKWKMWCALKRFAHTKNKKYLVKSRDYEIIALNHKKAISNLLKGRKLSEEAKRNMSIGQKKYFENKTGHFTGRIHTKESKKLMSQKQSGKNNPQYGKSRTSEEKQKISNTMFGTKKSAETIEKFKNRRHPLEIKSKISEGLRKYHAERKRNKME